jgi:hypothetical protein
MWTKTIGRNLGRWFLLSAGVALAVAALTGAPGLQAQQPKEVKVAVIAPISGAWARQGQLIQMGAEMAVDEINQRGGIKALGGAKLKLLVADAGDSAEKAKNAAQRLIAQEPDLIGGTGAWLSTFTLAVTEVTERAQIPWLTLSFADSITDRGFKYVFQTSPSRAGSRRARCRRSWNWPRSRPARRRARPASSATTRPRRSSSSSRCAKAVWRRWASRW